MTLILPTLISNLPAIITALGTIALGWFTYNLYTKNKETDRKIEKWKEDEILRRKHDGGKIAAIYGSMWELLHFLKSDRVYIILPHPLTRALYISATLEVKRNGVTSIKEDMTNIPICNIAKFSSMIAAEDFIAIENTDDADVDKKMKAIISNNGSKKLYMRRLTDIEDRWIGNIVVGYTNEDVAPAEAELIEKLTRDAATIIQGLLPDHME